MAIHQQYLVDLLCMHIGVISRFVLLIQYVYVYKLEGFLIFYLLDLRVIVLKQMHYTVHIWNVMRLA